ncbi:hypothetical protein SBA4_280010 [Candidatus Sulfopaludibacter sp. SbA4]|nr:hypothetical protein SBA4_280010 [Candidatus Sulfopaludibacter sp. SbA4]
MPNYIVLHPTPAAAIDPATFTSYLSNLTITAYDIWHDNSSGQVAPATLAVTPAWDVGADSRKGDELSKRHFVFRRDN